MWERRNSEIVSKRMEAPVEGAIIEEKTMFRK